MNNNYGFGKTVTGSFNILIAKVTNALQKEGFGILSDIDVATTLKKKLNLDIPPYRILGACNPQLAHRALEAEASIGLLLPCNVVIREDQNREIYVEILDPNIMVVLTNNQKIKPLAIEARERLERVLAEL